MVLTRAMPEQILRGLEIARHAVGDPAGRVAEDVVAECVRLSLDLGPLHRWIEDLAALTSFA